MRTQPLSRGSVTQTCISVIEATEPGADDRLIPAIAADGALFPIDKLEAHRKGVLHLAVSVFVMSGDHLLMQRRALSKYHCGGLWANTCCSHPDWNESPADAASRRLREEMGLDLALESRNIIEYAADVTNGLHEHERVHVFRGEADMKRLIRPNPNEVLATRWISLSDLQHDLRRQPELYAPWFRIYLSRWSELGL